ncbi:hypothetical protein [Mesoterricola silvestris]|uniref:Uncharacterized protein n=1 Tax=Mesoterricola silvestris TaxID=2927979 RepID=A0AA48GH33_9BACT|nr:hypothetical protein [Mesoterricola silvestris]BDU72731.1 hypothetical protein METEAL_19050 [Mesoterricola silvestris]
MSRRQRHTPRIGGNAPERRKALFDRRRRGPVFRFVYGVTLLPLGHLLHTLTGGRIPVRAGDN